MDRLKRFALSKVAAGLDKALAAKEHFDKKQQKKTYTQKVNELKKHFAAIIFSNQEGDKEEAWTCITKLDRLMSEHELLDSDRKMIDEMHKKHV